MSQFRRGISRAASEAMRATGISALALTAITLTAGPAAAGTKVYSPTVEKGELEIETRGIVDNDGNAKMKTGIGYGITDFWFAEVYANWERDPGGPYDVDSIELESLFQLTPHGKYWADFGLLAEYSIATRAHALDELEIGPLVEKQIGRTIHTANFIFVKEIGSGADDVEFEYAWSSRWRLKPYFQPGFEAFGEIGEINDVGPLRDQEHQLGPALTGTIPLGFGPGKLHYEAAYLFGLTDGTSDGAFRWLLEYEVRF